MWLVAVRVRRIPVSLNIVKHHVTILRPLQALVQYIPEFRVDIGFVDTAAELAFQVVLELDRAVVYLVDFVAVQGFMQRCISAIELLFVNDVIDVLSTVVEVVSERVTVRLEVTLLVISIDVDMIETFFKSTGNT
jgi:cytochrome c oxidase subunit IV